MKFLKVLNRNKLSKAIVCGLLVSSGMLIGTEQAAAEIIREGDTLKVYGTHNHFPDLSFQGIRYINFYIDSSIGNGSLMISAGKDYLNFSSIREFRVGVQTSSKLQVDDWITLVACKGQTGFRAGKCTVLQESDYKEFGLRFDDFLNRLPMVYITSLPNKGITKEAKSPVETRLAGLTMLNLGADMLTTQGFDNAASAVADEINAGGSTNSLTPFVVISGNKTKVKSGSHIDVKGKNLNVGFAKELNNKAGKLLIGPFVEYGKGSYDSYLDDGYHGEGTTKYIGGGVMAKQTNANGFYYEGSLRAGKLDENYKAKENHFSDDATYYGAHIGVGKTVRLSDKNSLDCYGKYFYTNQKGKNTALYAGDIDYDLHFDSVKSNRTKIGSRLTHFLNEKNSLYAGLAWQHEFSGTARATIDGGSTPAPSVKGNTGLMELGWKVEASKKMELDLNAVGYTGKQKGASLNLSANFKF